MIKKTSLLLFSILLVAGVEVLLSQNANFTPSKERSSFDERRKSILDANNLRSTYHNYGFGGRTSENNRDELYYEYPKNTNRRYIYFVSIFTGAEVTNQVNTPGQERFPIVVAPNYRTNPSTSDSWAQNPIKGYFNDSSEELARSDRGPARGEALNTWPSDWPDKRDDESDPGWAGQWNGFFGKGIFNADQEFFYRSGDDRYTAYRDNTNLRYRPDITDDERGGLGLIMDTRILAWTQNLISNVHFNIFEIRNDASFDYNKVSFMLWTADWVGTPQDDRPFFDQQRATAFYTDTTPTASPAEFDGTAIGVAGIRFLETPGNASDGIDNDGDSDFYIRDGPLYDQRNQDLMDDLTTALGGFFNSRAIILNEVIPQFTSNSFVPRDFLPGDPIVFIDEDGNRILTRYPENTGVDNEIISQGRVVTLPAAGLFAVREDTSQGRHLNLLDDDFDGLIDENQPNHLTLSRLVGTTIQTRPVRYINYLWDGYYTDIQSFADRDTLQRGLVVPNSWIRERMDTDADFSSLVVDYQNMLKNLYSGRLDTSQFDHYFQNRHTSAPMIDESREDFFDNNKDWRAGSDDVGIDGVEGTGTRGEGDGFPSSGAFTPFPGETNIDKTDVRETDAIGISSATFRPAGGLNLSGNVADRELWQNHMQPGRFTPAPDATQDTDQFITSSFFPLPQGGIQRFAVAITVAQANTPNNNADLDLVERQLNDAFNAFDANYQFATAPPPPVVRAVPGNGRVVLYWDDAAELAFDRYLERLGLNPFNFEGYKVYRATDPALLDARKITDGRGNLQFLQPIEQYDLINGITGSHPVDINGLEYYMGSDNGIKRSFIDTDVINGRIYYYAVIAYNNGAPTAGIAPAESPINLSINPDGSLVAGVNVVKVIPTGQSAGYVGPQSPDVTYVTQGVATGDVWVEIVDPREVLPNNTYRVTFSNNDTAAVLGADANVWMLENITSGDILLENRTELNREELPVVQGFRVNVGMPLPTDKIVQQSWTTKSNLNSEATFTAITLNGSDGSYRLVFDENSSAYTTVQATVTRGAIRQRVPETQTNLRVIDIDSGVEVPFALLRDPNLDTKRGRTNSIVAYFDSSTQSNDSDIIFILKENGDVAYEITLNPHQSEVVYAPMVGDEVRLMQTASFGDGDVYEFTIDADMNTAKEDLSVARSRLNDIRVVPNPYIVSNIVENRPTPVRPQQERQLHFINLPAKCTIRIFNVAGQLIQTLNVNNSIDNDRYVWDMLTKDNLDMSYGIYIYHVEAPGIGEKTGKFAVIK